MSLQGLEFVTQCVKPKCTTGRWLDVQVDRKLHRLILQEYIHPTSRQCESTHISLPADFKERVVNPVCIGLNDNICIIQYITKAGKFVRFFLVDLSTLTIKLFEDGEHYINKDIASIFPVECLISPSKSTVIFRLPQPVMSARKWSKMLSAELIVSDSETGGYMYDITNIKGYKLRDRKNQAVAFDPRYEKQLTHVLLDEYCVKCTIMVYDLSTRKGVTEKTHKLVRRLSVSEANSGSDSDSSSGWEDEYHFLLECNIEYSHSGEVFIVCCLVQNTDQTQTLIRNFIFDSNSLHLIGNMETNLSKSNIKVYVVMKQLFVPIFSAGDRNVSVWHLEKHHPPRKVGISCEVPLLGPPRLQCACRTVIVERCGMMQSLNKLNLPPRLISFLQFKQTLL